MSHSPRLFAGSALAVTVGATVVAVLGAAPPSVAVASSSAPAVRHHAGTAMASCRDGSGTRWKVSVRWNGSYRTGQVTKVDIASLRWTTTRPGTVRATVAASVKDGNGHRAGSVKRTVTARYRGGRTAYVLNPVNPVADDAPARVGVTIGSRGVRSCHLDFTEPISKPRPRPTAKPTSRPTSKPSPTSPAPTSPAPTSPAPTSTTGSATDVYRSDVFAGTDAERAKAKLSAFGTSDCVTRYAQAQAERMAAEQRMYHQELGPILSSCGLRTVGENVAYGYSSGASVVNGWMNSPGHRANILNASFRLLGVGAARSADGRWYAAQVFGG